MNMFLKTFTTIIFGFSTFGGEMLCTEQAEAFSSKVSASKVTELSRSCIEQALSYALMPESARRGPASIRRASNPKMVDLNPKVGINTYAHANYLVLEKEAGKYKVYAGSKTGLTRVLGVTLSHDGEYVAALNQSLKGNEIIIFKTSYSGNISPHKVIRGQELSEVTQITYNNSGKELYLHDLQNKKITSVNVLKDSRKSSEEFKPVFKELLKLDEKMKVSFIKSDEASFLALSGKNLYSFDNELKKKNWVLDLGAIGLENPKGFQISKNGKEIQIYTQGNKLDTILYPGK